MGRKKMPIGHEKTRLNHMSGRGATPQETLVHPLARAADIDLKDAMIIAAGETPNIHPEKVSAFQMSATKAFGTYDNFQREYKARASASEETTPAQPLQLG